MDNAVYVEGVQPGGFILILLCRPHYVDSWVSSSLDRSFMWSVAASVWFPSVITQHIVGVCNICKCLLGWCLGWILRLFECRGALLCGTKAIFHHLPRSFLSNLISCFSKSLPLDKRTPNSPFLFPVLPEVAHSLSACTNNFPNIWATFELKELVGNPYLTFNHIHAVRCFQSHPLGHLV